MDARSRLSAAFLLLLTLAAVGCGNPVGEAARALGAAKDGKETAAANEANESLGERVKPPFAVQGELEGLLLVWFDAEGVHTAQKRSEIPEASRERVRIDSLSTPPEQRLDPERVYVADLRAPAADGSYVVREAPRAWFDAQVDARKPPPEAEPALATASTDVVIYKAAWCGVCRKAAQFLRQRGVPFVEKDIEKDSAAQAEMLTKARAKGVAPTGVPVIDFRGELLLGFDQARLSELIDRYGNAL